MDEDLGTTSRRMVLGGALAVGAVAGLGAQRAQAAPIERRRPSMICPSRNAALARSLTAVSCRWPICASRIAWLLSRYTAINTDSTRISGISALCTNARQIH